MRIDPIQPPILWTTCNAARGKPMSDAPFCIAIIKNIVH